MTTRIRKDSGLVLAAALVVFATAATARADERIVANVPFSFVVGDVRLPAGKYVVKTISDEDPGVWAIASADGRQSVLITTIRASSPTTTATPELVFDKFDNQYFLARLVNADEDREIPLTPARMEHEILKLSAER